MLPLPATVFLTTLVLYALCLKIFPKLGLLDFPERYGLTRPRLPYPTGVIPVVVFLCTLPFLVPIGQKEIGLIVAVLLLTLTCFIDDRSPLPARLRLLVQIVAAITLFLTGSQIYTITSPFGGFLKLDSLLFTIPHLGAVPVLSGVFTVFWLLLTINAMNWFDGIPGQVGVVSLIGFLMLGLLAQFRNGQPDVAMLSYSLAAIAAAGIFFDFPPTKMLLGDTGSMFFGLMLGLLGVYQGGKVATAFLAIGIPILDAAFVIAGRLLRGTSPLSGGRDHLHHRLRALGYSERIIVIATALVGALFGVSALFLSTRGKVIAGLVLLLCLLVTQWKIRSTSGRSPSAH